MKVLIVNTEDIIGGAAKAAYRLHTALKKNNIDSYMLVQKKSTTDWTVIAEENKIKKAVNNYRSFIDQIPAKNYKKKTKTLFSSSWISNSAVIKKIKEINPDVIHFHWITGGMFKIESFSKINYPIVWNCQDMYPFTGGCHFDEECGRYKKNCGKCKVLGSSKENDLSRKVFKRKRNTFKKIKDLTIVGVSKWITQCAKESTLFKEREVVNLPNCLDTDVFKKIDKNLVRGLFNIPKQKKKILFACSNILDLRKGAKEFFLGIDNLEIKNVEIIIAGMSAPQKKIKCKYPIYFIPPVSDDISLSLMYNVADVLVFPSIQENLSNTIIESLACGVPVVAFDIGGNSDMVKHKINGYLAKEKDIQDMTNGIKWIISNKKYDALSKNARKIVLENFSQKVIVKKYIELYKKKLAK